MDYELVELSTGNLVEAYADTDASLSDVRAIVKTYGEDAVDTLALGHRVNGRIEVLATGENLRAMAFQGAPAIA